ncbi:MAG: hypothetical protein Q4Q53_06625 [Methanocorpusculum sp.]|nr:hypothetical protein [Methanocorpusculum sp.]
MIKKDKIIIGVISAVILVLFTALLILTNFSLPSAVSALIPVCLLLLFLILMAALFIRIFSCLGKNNPDDK